MRGSICSDRQGCTRSPVRDLIAYGGTHQPGYSDADPLTKTETLGERFDFDVETGGGEQFD